jgi:transcriptional repressor NrdR
MKCPFCGYNDSKVVDSRPSEDGAKIRRRRECNACCGRFTTYEMIERIPLMVIKKDKSRELFDREKLFNGLRRACEKRPVSVAQLEELVAEIESELCAGMEHEIPTEKIGALAMEKLKGLDEVSYVRFASVYRAFKDVHTFMAELSVLLAEKKAT